MGDLKDKLVFLIGFMGVGKSYVARSLSSELDFEVIELDREIENACGQTVSEIFEREGEDFFRKKEHELLVNTIKSGGHKIISCGGGTPCFYRNMNIMNDAGLTIFLSKDVPDILSNILRNPERRPLLANKSRAEIKAYIRDTLTERKKYYTQARLIIHGYHDKMLVDKVRARVEAYFNPELIQ